MSVLTPMSFLVVDMERARVCSAYAQHRKQVHRCSGVARAWLRISETEFECSCHCTPITVSNACFVASLGPKSVTSFVGSQSQRSRGQ